MSDYQTLSSLSNITHLSGLSEGEIMLVGLWFRHHSCWDTDFSGSYYQTRPSVRIRAVAMRFANQWYESIRRQYTPRYRQLRARMDVMSPNDPRWHRMNTQYIAVENEMYNRAEEAYNEAMCNFYTARLILTENNICGTDINSTVLIVQYLLGFVSR